MPRFCFLRHHPRFLLLIAGLGLAGWSGKLGAQGQTTALAEVPDYLAAGQAMAEGLHEVAAVKYERLLTTGTWERSERAALARLTAEAWVRSGRVSEALRFTESREFNDMPFWRGQALLQARRYEEAETAFRAYPAEGKLAAFAKLGLCHSLVGQEREGTARRECKDLRTSTDANVAKHARLLFNELELGTQRTQVVLDRLLREKPQTQAETGLLVARALITKGDLPAAQKHLRAMLNTQQDGGERAHDAATILLAEVLWRQGKPEGQGLLVALLNSLTRGEPGRRNSTAYWSEAFDLLSRMNSTGKPDDKLLAAAVGWASYTATAECRGHATWFIARELHRAGRDAEATGMLEGFIQEHANHPRRSEVLRLAMQLHGATNTDDRVLALAERWRRDFRMDDQSVVDFLVGIIRFGRGEHLEAMQLFAAAAQAQSDTSTHRRALYNAAIAAIEAGQQATLATLLTQLTEPPATAPASGKPLPPPAESAADVLLDQALALAAKGDLSAEISLGAFVKDHAQHPRTAEARIAMAEIALLDVPPRVKPANEALATAAATPNLPPHLAERIGYDRVWMQEAAGDPALVAEAGKTFIQTWPRSGLVAEVRMKVGEAYYRLGDYSNARTQFELLDHEQPDSPYADAALFYAGKAAMNLTSVEGLNAAIDLWDTLAERQGPLAFAARQHQAQAKRRLGQEVEALSMIEALLGLPEATGEARLSLLVEKAELLLLLGKTDAKSTEAAVLVLGEALSTPALPFLWAARLGYMKAGALEDLGRISESLEACHDIVRIGSNQLTTPASPAEYRWYYSAGFLAIDLLEKSQQWEAAARVAEQLASSGGSRSAEAKQRATDIRLEHFLWDDNRSGSEGK